MALKFSPKTTQIGVNTVYAKDYDGAAVTPADGTDLPNGAAIGLAVTGAGNVSVNLAGGGTAVLTGLAAGQLLPVAVTRVLATGTTATGIFALYLPAY